MRQIATRAVAAVLPIVLLGVLGGCRPQAGTMANSDNKLAQSARTPAYWNPVIDGQFAVVRNSRKSYGKGATCDVYQALPPHVLKSFLCDGLIVYDWSRDGRELITLEWDGGSYHKEIVNQSGDPSFVSTDRREGGLRWR